MRELELIQRLKNKHAQCDTSNFNLLDFLGAFGSPLDALMYSRLFWPAFVEFNEMVFVKEIIDDEETRDRIIKAQDEYGGNLSAVEDSFNFFEIPSSIFGRSAAESTEKEDRELAEVLVSMWSARLKMVYSDRAFKVAIVEPEESGGDIGIIFHTIR